MPSSEVMHKFGAGTLHSGSASGPKVTSRAQAIAITASEKDKEDANGGVYPENHFQGGRIMSKSSGLHDASYAQGGSVLGRTKDFLKTADRFRSDGGTNRDPKPEPTEDVWGKNKSASNPKGRDKSEKPVLPR